MAKTKLPETSHTHCQIIGGSAIYKAIHKTLATIGEKTIFPSKATPVAKATVVFGGTPITKELAIELGHLVFGVATWKTPWLNSGFCFRAPEKALSFGLLTYKNEVKGLMMCVQAYLMKHLLFLHDRRSSAVTVGKLLQPSAEDREEVLLFALIDILLKVSGESKRIVLCLPQQENIYYEQSPEISMDGVTEKLHLFEFYNGKDAQDFLKKYFSVFLESPGCGCILFLYSLVLTKNFLSLRNELGNKQDQLLNNYGGCSQALVNLILTGIATSYTHNGIVIENEDLAEQFYMRFKKDLYTAIETRQNKLLFYELEEWRIPQLPLDKDSQRKVGAMERSEIGQLIWQQSDQCGSMIGSRLKTPRFPIWVTRIGGQFGVLFNPNRELTRDYRAENHFELHYYSSSRGQNDPIILNIDTRSERRRDERDVPLLERLILTKWHDATVFWNGSTPFF